ncbi:hypothetical protein RIF29_46555 [Crotalaria pallida]|uniref:Uncharacterized protein n=1 Tax=Crotalaria pallida TaxID=3830 RepID=A0AAN9DS47_CROPI
MESVTLLYIKLRKKEKDKNIRKYYIIGQDNMNVLLCSINTLKRLYDISAVEVGQHFYWQIGGFQVHAQVLITSWVVIAILLVSAILVVRNPQTIPTFGQNFFEYVLEFIRDLPHGELAAPTNDINTTVALALLTSTAYFYAGLSKKGLAYFVNISNQLQSFYRLTS